MQRRARHEDQVLLSIGLTSAVLGSPQVDVSYEGAFVGNGDDQIGQAFVMLPF